jgi:uridine kinase
MSGPSTRRRHVLDAVAASIPAARGEDCVRVAVDGVDGAGKTSFANELVAALTARGRAVVRIRADDFLNPRAVRHRRGRHSPEGFWLDSYDYGRLAADVLDPLGLGGSRRYRTAAHDLASDTAVRPTPQVAAPGSVLVVDGLFLHRDGLAELWDFSVFLDVPFEVTAARMAERDGTHPDPSDPSMTRYVQGQLLYFAACDPAARATIVIDNSDPQHPLVMSHTGHHPGSQPDW